VTYAEIVSAGQVNRTFSEDELKALPLKKFGGYKIVGQSMPQLDIPAKTDGTARYGIDVFVPNMVYAKWLSPPVRWGAMPKSVNDSAAKSIDGYIGALVVEDPTNVQKGYAFAIGETYHAADAAAKAIDVSWDLGPFADVSTDTILGRAKDLVNDPNAGFAWVLDGDVDAGMGSAVATHEAEYVTNILYHGVMEPMNCVAMEQDGVYHLFTGNQWQTRAGAMVAEAVGVDPANVVIHQQYLGGGFGRRLEPDAMIPAALAAKELGRPVKLVYDREQDVRFDFHRSLTFQRIKAGVDAGGRLVAVDHTVCAGWSSMRAAPGFLADSVDKKGRLDPASMNGSDFWYTVPNHFVRGIENELATAATPPGFLRAVAPGWTFWCVESFLDEMARKIGKDPLLMRIDMLDATGKNAGTPPNSVGGARRLRNALMTAAGKAGYGVKPLAENTGMGIAAVSSQERGSPSWTACVAEVHVDPASGAPTVKKLTIAMDIGTVVNPDGALAQLEGSALWGVSHALKEKCTLSNGAIDQANFDTYEVLRIDEVPEVDITLIESGHYPAGTGEPVVTVVPPAIANAIDDAVGARVRELPITADAIKAAMA
jgi:isoquinoline 1-oxidoreductase